MTDTRYVYGTHCSWHGPISAIGWKRGGLPCCPHCSGLLFETTETDWWEGVRRYAVEHPGYEEFVRWTAHPRHFKNTHEALAAYNAEFGTDFKF